VARPEPVGALAPPRLLAAAPRSFPAVAPPQRDVWELSALHLHWLNSYDPDAPPSAPLACHRDFADARNRLREWGATCGTRHSPGSPLRRSSVCSSARTRRQPRPPDPAPDLARRNPDPTRTRDGHRQPRRGLRGPRPRRREASPPRLHRGRRRRVRPAPTASVSLPSSTARGGRCGSSWSSPDAVRLPCDGHWTRRASRAEHGARTPYASTTTDKSRHISLTR
jgi:hypothetical protein